MSRTADVLESQPSLSLPSLCGALPRKPQACLPEVTDHLSRSPPGCRGSPALTVTLWPSTRHLVSSCDRLCFPLCHMRCTTESTHRHAKGAQLLCVLAFMSCPPPPPLEHGLHEGRRVSPCPSLVDAVTQTRLRTHSSMEQLSVPVAWWHAGKCQSNAQSFLPPGLCSPLPIHEFSSLARGNCTAVSWGWWHLPTPQRVFQSRVCLCREEGVGQGSE